MFHITHYKRVCQLSDFLKTEKNDFILLPRNTRVTRRESIRYTCLPPLPREIPIKTPIIDDEISALAMRDPRQFQLATATGTDSFS